MEWTAGPCLAGWKGVAKGRMAHWQRGTFLRHRPDVPSAAEDGNLTPFLRACGDVFGGSGSRGSGVAACGIDLRVSGDYTVNFTATDSAGATAWAARTVRVCPTMEVVCGDLTCSVGEDNRGAWGKGSRRLGGWAASKGR
jgi:hypothetical protein